MIFSPLGRPSSQEISQIDARSIPPVSLLASLGASCCLIFRALSLPLPFLILFFVSHSLSWPLCFQVLSIFQFFQTPESPGTSKINEKPKVFFGFLVFSRIAQDDRKSFENAPEMVTESLQDSPKPFPNPSKTLQDGPKTPPTRPLALQGARKARPSCAQDAPKLPQIPHESPKTPSRPFQSLIFDSLGNSKLQFFDDFSDYLILQALSI